METQQACSSQLFTDKTKTGIFHGFNSNLLPDKTGKHSVSDVQNQSAAPDNLIYSTAVFVTNSLRNTITQISIVNFADARLTSLHLVSLFFNLQHAQSTARSGVS